MPLQTSADKPAPLRTVSNALGTWIDKLGWIWVEAQIAELNRRQGRVFLTLRDTAADLSVQAMCSAAVLDSVASPVTEGARVVVHAKPRFYDRRGSLSFMLDQIRPVGQGELLARIEQRRRLLAAEGLFAADRKRRLPFLPGCIGLVTGRDSAAERDVVSNARRRWPGVAFRVEHAVVQGVNAAREVIEALRRLEADPAVDVIVIARGGGSLEDLLAFSDEGLVRVVAALRTPVVSAIGHEQDNPIVDLVADLRASTPTDAAKCLVPDVSDEERTVRQATGRLRRAVHQRLATEEHRLTALRSRPCLAAPYALVEQRRADVVGLSSRSRRVVQHRLERAADDLGHSVARVRALSPLATLQRGYAVVTTGEGHVLAGVGDAHAGDSVAVRLHDGQLAATVTAVDARHRPDPGAQATPGESAP